MNVKEQLLKEIEKTPLLETNDFASGSLNNTSYIKANRVFTANEQLIA